MKEEIDELGTEEDIVDDDEDLDDEELSNEDELYDDDLGEEFDPSAPPIEKHSELLKNLTNFSPYIKETHNNWLGITWDEEKGCFTKNPYIDPVMSIHGATWCSGFLKTYARGNNIITDIGSPEYKNIMADIIDAVWLNLGTRDEFKVVENGDLLRVGNELEHAAALVLMGAGDGKYNKFLGTAYQHSSSDSGQPQQQMQQPIIMTPMEQRKNRMVDRLKRMLN